MGSQRPAIILSDCGTVSKTLTYDDVTRIKTGIMESISPLLTEKHTCVGLQMSHNLYIPSIVLSLQELHHCYMFIPCDRDEAEIIVNNLGIMWVLSFTPSEKSTITIDLHPETLSVEQYSCQPRFYKEVCYIIRTSGTTGDCKYVQVTKQSIESNVRCLSRIFNVTCNDMIYFGTPLTFDPSMIELFLALHNSACLLITTSQNQINSSRLYQTLFCAKNDVTILQIVPSIFLRWTQDQMDNILAKSRLRILAFGGECFPRSILNRRKSKALRVFNLYGITEVSCWATAHEIQDTDTDEIPLGEALDDTLIEIRDDNGQVMSDGAGEIYIGSHTRICFVDGKRDNLQIPTFHATGDVAVINKEGFFYKGRKNDVIKRFGHKLRPSKIEEQIEKETGLKNKCVWSKSQSKLLLFFINESVDKNTKDKMLDKLRIRLLHTIPKHCFPDYIDMIRKCPSTSHGKTDKRTLESMFLNRERVDPNRTDVIQLLICKFFGLNVDQLTKLRGMTFFELGGYSMLAIQFLSELENELGGECPQSFVTALFENDLGTCIDHFMSLNISRKRPEVTAPQTSAVSKRSKIQVDLKITWTHNLDACVDSTPVIFTFEDRTFVAVGSFSQIFAVLDAATGEEVAKFVLPDVIESSPCPSSCCNFLFVGCFDGKMYCLDYVKNQIKWVYRTGDRIKCTPRLCLQSTSLVFGSYDKSIHCVDAPSGKAVWTTSISESVTSTPIVHQNKIYAATICGTCLCLSEDTGCVLWKYQSGSPIFGNPCVYKQTILWPNVRGYVVGTSAEGRKLWRYDCGGHLYSSLVPHRDSVLFGCQDKCLYFLHLDLGVPKARVVSLDDVLTTPCIYDDSVVVAGNSGRLFLVNVDGESVGEIELPSHVFSSVVVHDERIFVGCRDNNLYCIKINKH